MFLSRVQIGSYQVESIQVGSFRIRIYSDRFRFFRVKEIYPQKILVNFWYDSRSGIFGSVLVRVFGSRLKWPGLVIMYANLANCWKTLVIWYKLPSRYAHKKCSEFRSFCISFWTLVGVGRLWPILSFLSPCYV